MTTYHIYTTNFNTLELLEFIAFYYSKEEALFAIEFELPKGINYRIIEVYCLYL